MRQAPRVCLYGGGDGFRLPGGRDDRVGGGDNQVELLLCGHPPSYFESLSTSGPAQPVD